MTSNIGIRSIISKLEIEDKEITSEDVGFKIAPLINAVGRIGDPKLIIDLLTNESEVKTERLTKECFAMNKERKRLTTLIEHEALELALRMARVYTGGEGIICSSSTYHGNSFETIRMTVGPFEPEFRRVPYPQTFRPEKQGLSEEELTELYLEKISEQIQAFKKDGIKFAGLIFCSIFANEGLPNFSKDYLSKASKLVREAGGVVILDEVQAGFGRTGTWWGYELSGLVPDICVMGKPMGAGIPVSGVVSSTEISDDFHKKWSYFNTTAATPVQAAVGSTVIDIIEEENLIQNAKKVGAYLKKQLDELQEKYEFIGDVRGPGLFLGLEVIDNKEDKNPDKTLAENLVESLKEKYFLISNAGEHRNVLKLRPPLVFDISHADLLLDALDDSFKKISS